MTGLGPRPHVVATAGHVDHGKSTLVRALTGTDPDRLAEEKRRGLTIDLGFAALPIDGVGPVAVVDVPGHERFIATMLAGVAVVEAVVLCVDAGEGWRAQTEEHLRIVQLAGIDRGLVAVTKAATVPSSGVAAVVADVRSRLAGGPGAHWAVVPCDAETGSGLPDVVAALADVLRSAPPPVDAGRPRMWIDRSFAIAGAGAVVTGGVAHGAFTVGDTVEVVTTAGVRPARVRAIQRHGEEAASAPAGCRAALNLAGVSHRAMARGDAVVRPGEWGAVDEVEVALAALAGAPAPVRERGAHLAYVGSEEVAARLRVVGAGAVAAGTTGTVRLRLPRRLPLVVGDRVVVRDAGRGVTVAGGPITRLDPTAVTRAPLPPSEAAVLARIEASRPAGLDRQSLDAAARAAGDALVGRGAVAVERGYLVGAAWARELADHPFVAALRAEPFAPPPPADHDVGPDLLRALVRRGLLVGRDGVWFAAEAPDQAAARLRADAGDGFTLADARDALGTSRRVALALCEVLDARGTTRRAGDRRIFRPGPAAAGHDGR